MTSTTQEMMDINNLLDGIKQVMEESDEQKIEELISKKLISGIVEFANRFYDRRRWQGVFSRDETEIMQKLWDGLHLIWQKLANVENIGGLALLNGICQTLAPLSRRSVAFPVNIEWWRRISIDKSWEVDHCLQWVRITEQRLTERYPEAVPEEGSADDVGHILHLLRLIPTLSSQRNVDYWRGWVAAKADTLGIKNLNP